MDTTYGYTLNNDIEALQQAEINDYILYKKNNDMTELLKVIDLDDNKLVVKCIDNNFKKQSYYACKEADKDYESIIYTIKRNKSSISKNKNNYSVIHNVLEKDVECWEHIIDVGTKIYVATQLSGGAGCITPMTIREVRKDSIVANILLSGHEESNKIYSRLDYNTIWFTDEDRATSKMHAFVDSGLPICSTSPIKATLSNLSDDAMKIEYELEKMIPHSVYSNRKDLRICLLNALITLVKENKLGDK